MKRILSRFTSFFLAAVLVFAFAPSVFAEEEIFYFQVLSDTEARLIYCDANASGAVVVPSEYEGRAVTEIYGDAFSNCYNITSITLPETVEKIGTGAFMGCSNLTSVNIPALVTEIPQNAFVNCTSLTSFDIPDTVTSIVDSAFSGCKSLESVKLPAGLTKIDRNVFGGCWSLQSANIPEGVTSIGELAFSGCQLNEVKLPERLESIDKEAFAGNNFTTVKIPASVKKIGDGAFRNLDVIESVSVDENNPFFYSKDGCLMEKGTDTLLNATKELIIPEGTKKIGNYVFYYASTDEIEIPEGVTHIGDSAFYESSIKRVELPDSLISIGTYAFSGCQLESVVLPYGFETLGAYAFAYCNSLESIGLYSNIAHIGAFAFQGTEYYNNEENWDGVALYIGTNLIKVKNNVNEAVTVKDGTTLIADLAFESCRNMPSVTFPKSLKAIGGGAFYLCNSIEAIDLSATQVKSLSQCETQPYIYGAFQSCSRLKTALLPETLEQVGANAFYCSGLEEIKLPEGVVSIGYTAFSYCNALAKLELPSSLREIGSYAFSNDSLLKEIKLPDSLTFIGENIFSNNGYYSDKSNWEDGALYFGKYLLKVDKSVTSCTVKDGTEQIASGALGSYPGYLKSVTLPEGLLAIHDEAFYYTDLESLTIPSTVVTIGENILGGSKKITQVIFKDTKVWYEDGENVSEEILSDPAAAAEFLRDGNEALTKKYLVIFENYDGEILSKEEYLYGAVPEYPEIFPTRPNENGYTYFFFGWDGDLGYCTKHQILTASYVETLVGDINDQEGITADDAIYLLYHVFFGSDDYPINQYCDFNGDNSMTADDAIYLLYYVFFGEESYPLH